MSAQSIISRYNHMNGNAVSGATLREFHDSIQKYLDRSGTGPFTHAINGIRKRLAAALNSVKTNDVVEVRVKVIDSDEQVAGYQVPVKVVKKKKTVSIPEQHRKKIEAQNKRMPKPIRDVMNGNDQDLLHGLELNPVEAHESGLGFTQTGQQKIYDMITGMVLDTMKKDGLFWRKKWDAGGAYNARSFPALRPYSGINWFILTMIANLDFGYSSPYFLTFKAAKQQGGSVKKKAESWPVIYYNRILKLGDKKITEEQYEKLPKDERKKVNVLPFIQYYSVFNGEDVEGVDLPKTKKQEAILSKPEPEAIESCEKIVSNMPNRPDIDHGHRTAHYLPGSDKIDMPDKRTFADMQAYYSVLFHEMVHSTGHQSRVKREMKGDHESKEYYFEELIAELGASYLCAHAGILYHTLNDTAVYVKHYREKLSEIMQDDKKFFLRAAAAAQRAVDYIIGNNTKTRKQEKRKETFKPKSRGKKIIKANDTVDLIKKAAKVGKRKVEVKFVKPYSEKEHGNLPTVVKNKLKKAKAKTEVFDVVEESSTIMDLIKNPKHVASMKLKGVVDAQTLAGISYSTFDLAPEWKKEFHKINSDSVLMIWGKPGSGKTVKLLKLAQHLSADLNKKVLYLAEEEYGRSTLADKLTEHKIGNGNLSFAPDLDEGIVRNFDAVFLDSVNSMHLSPADVKNLIRKYPGKCWVLIVQTTKEGDFRGGRDWEHLVDIAGEVVNRKMILRKNRLDPNNKAKADKLLVEEIVTEKKQAQEIKDLVKQKIEGEQKQQAA